MGEVKIIERGEVTAPPPARTFVIHKGSDILVQGSPKSYLIKKWIPKGRYLGCIFGASGSKKTFNMEDMCLHIATGRTLWNGCKVNQGNVLYFCGEGFEDFKERVRAWFVYHGYTDDESNRILDAHFRYSDEPISLDEESNLSDVIAKISLDGWRPDFVVVDTLVRHMSGNENQTQDARNMISAFDTMEATYNCTVCYVHHTGQSLENQDRQRGASAFKAALDFEMKCEAEDTASGYGYVLKQTKMKSGRCAPMIHAVLVETATGWYDEDGEMIFRGVPVQNVNPPELSSNKIGGSLKEANQKRKDFDKLNEYLKQIKLDFSEDGRRSFRRTDLGNVICMTSDTDYAHRHSKPDGRDGLAGRCVQAGFISYDKGTDRYTLEEPLDVWTFGFTDESGDEPDMF